MDKQVKNHWALILGGSQGLGLATAKKLAQEGYHICIVHRDRRADLENIQKEFAEIESFGRKLLTYNKDILQTIKRTEILEDFQKHLPQDEKIKVLVHSVAKGSLKPMQGEEPQSLGLQDFHITLDAMALSLYDWTKALLKIDLFDTDARVLAFTSEGNTKVLPNYGAVSVAKAALEAIVRQMALEFAPLNIKANCIQAGVTPTRSFAMIPGSEKLKAHALKRNPNNRLTTPEDVANVAYLLTLPEAQWITGTVVKADGGESLQ
jgi:enoyl-[acyl-carrier protein] reductase I